MNTTEKWNNQLIQVINEDEDCTIENQTRQEFTNAMNHCMDLLRENNLITNVNLDIISRRSAIIGQEIYEYLKQILIREVNLKSSKKYDKRTPQNNEIINNENTLNTFIKQESIEIIDTQQPENFVEQKFVGSKRKLKTTSRLSTKINSKNNKLLTDKNDLNMTKTMKKSGVKRDYTLIPLDEKAKVINIAHLNPTWGLKELRKYGSKKLNSMNTLRKWNLHVKSGGTKLDKLNMINCITYSKYIEACQYGQIITTAMIREWAMKAAEKFIDAQFKFEASHPWIYKFKLQHGIPSDDTTEPNYKSIP